jgi:hypothetical protein
MDINISLKDMDLVAWWGAIVATGVLIWDVYKWRTSGARLRLRANPNMIKVGGSVEDKKQYVAVWAANTGDRPTTVTNLCFQYYRNTWNYFRNKPRRSMVVTSPSEAQPIPFRLGPGEEWLGMAIQDRALTFMAKKGVLVAEVYHAQASKAARKRISIKSEA